MPITMQPVRSSNIAEVGYSPESEVLHVRFKSGALWEYTQITPEKFASFINAPSVGGYYAVFIKSTGTGRKVEDAPPATTDATLAADLAASVAAERAADPVFDLAYRHAHGDVRPEMKPIVDAMQATLLDSPKIPFSAAEVLDFHKSMMTTAREQAESRRYVPLVLDDLAGPFAVAPGGTSPKYSSEGGTNAAADLIGANKVIQADVEERVALGNEPCPHCRRPMVDYHPGVGFASASSCYRRSAERGPFPIVAAQAILACDKASGMVAAMAEAQVIACPRCLGLTPLGCPECAGIGSVSR